MAVETLFTICNTLVLPQWLLLIIAPHWKVTQKLSDSYLIPLLLAFVYIFLFITHFSETQNGGFGSLTEVKNLFSNDYILLAGWVHYLAFDLVVGSWIARDGKQLGISHWLLIPCLLLTFMLGPAGLLTYYLIKTVFTSKNKAYENRKLL